MGESGKIEFSTTLEATRAADYLSRIAEGLRQGSITLKEGEQTVLLQAGQYVRLEIEAESKPNKSKGSLQLEVSWKESTAPDEDEETGETMEITAGPRQEPATAVPAEAR